MSDQSQPDPVPPERPEASLEGGPEEAQAPAAAAGERLPSDDAIASDPEPTGTSPALEPGAPPHEAGAAPLPGELEDEAARAAAGPASDDDRSLVEPAPEAAPEAIGGVGGDGATVAPAAAPGERVEWQPVVGSDQIEWQPVAVSETAEPVYGAAAGEPVPPPGGEPQPEAAAAGREFDPADTTAADGSYEATPTELDFEYPSDSGADEDWDAAESAEPVSPVTGNGATAGAGPVAGRPRTGDAGRRRAGAGDTSEAVPDDADASGRGASAPDKVRRQVLVLSILTGAVVLVAVVAFVLSRGAIEKGEQATPTTSQAPVSTVAPTLPESAFITYTDDATGFSLKMPRQWDRLHPPVADLRLVASAGDHDAFWVRVIPIQTPATVENIRNFKAVTDDIVFGDKSAKLLQEQLVTLNGLLAYYYLYTFHDASSNQEGLHAHYFVFEGQRMFSLIFQSVPTEDFRRQAGIFDQIAESFVARPATTTTTAAPPPTAPPETSPTTVP